MKGCSISLVVREIQSKTTMRFHNISTYSRECLKFKRLTILSVGKNVRQLELSYAILGGKMAVTLEKGLGVSNNVE